MEFTYNSYRNLLKLLLDKGYTIGSYENYFNYDKVAILRHDVDNSLQKALGFAELESEMHIKSTYFILLRTDLYNIASYKSVQFAKKINSLGHRIGLHFDEMAYSESEIKNIGIPQLIKTEIEILNQILGISINSVSMHRPSKETLDANYEIHKVINSYGEEFFKGFKYVSDSRRNWRENIEEIITSGKFEKLHILTHAFWYNDVEQSLSESIKEFINTANFERYSCVSDNISNMKEIMEETEVR